MSASIARNSSKPDGRQVGTVLTTERWWKDRYDDISKQGYLLHARYNPQWESSWFKTGNDSYTSGDGRTTTLRAAMDATRKQDGLLVTLKKVLPEEGPHELRINELFSSEEHARDHDNHCAPLLDIIELSTQFGSQKLMVFPFLRPFNQLCVQTFGEFVVFFTQICEGIRFMHQRSVAHRDFTAKNIMFSRSKLYPNGFLPAKAVTFKGVVRTYTRMRLPPRYYFVGLDLSVEYPSRDTLDEPWRGIDDSAPEHQSGRRCNPFHTDIYYVGKFVRKEFMEKCNGFVFMEDLITSMTHDDPSKRPLIENVLLEFSRIQASLSKRKLLSAITSKNIPKALGIIRQARHSLRTVWYILSRRSAFPSHPAVPTEHEPLSP